MIGAFGCDPDLDREEAELELSVLDVPVQADEVVLRIRPDLSPTLFEQREALTPPTQEVAFAVESVPAGGATIDVLALMSTDEITRTSTRVEFVSGEGKILRLSFTGSTPVDQSFSVIFDADDVDAPNGRLALRSAVGVSGQNAWTAAVSALASPPVDAELVSARATLLPSDDATSLADLWQGRLQLSVEAGPEVTEVASQPLSGVTVLDLMSAAEAWRDFLPGLSDGTLPLVLEAAAANPGEDIEARVQVDLTLRFR